MENQQGEKLGKIDEVAVDFDCVRNLNDSWLNGSASPCRKESQSSNSIGSIKARMASRMLSGWTGLLRNVRAPSW